VVGGFATAVSVFLDALRPQRGSGIGSGMEIPYAVGRGRAQPRPRQGPAAGLADWTGLAEIPPAATGCDSLMHGLVHSGLKDARSTQVQRSVITANYQH
jgi:hypothetical protein